MINRLYLSSELIKKDKDKELFILAKPFPGTGTDVVPVPTGGFPTFHLYRLPMVTKKWKPANIYVCHNGDLFGDWVPTEWIKQVFEACQKAPWHNYMFLTMNPKRYVKLLEANLLIQADNFLVWYTTDRESGCFTADGYHSFVCIEPMGLFAERIEIPAVEWILLVDTAD